MDGSDISDIWTSDSYICREQPYIPGTSEYIWYVIVIHNVFYVLNVPLK